MTGHIDRPAAARLFANREAAAWIAAVAIVAVACWFRVAGGTVHPLWLDEAYSAYAAAQGWTFLWTIVPRYETHPPFYYSLVRLWTLGFGDSLVALRSFGIVATMLSLPIAALAGREIARIIRPDRAGTGAALAALLLCAMAPYPLAMAEQVRPYPIMILVYTTACLALLRIGRGAAAGRGIPAALLAPYLVALALMLWLHNLGPLYAVAMAAALAVLVLRRGLTRGDWLRLIGGHVAVALIYLPAFLILIDQAPTWVKSTWLHFSTHGLQWRLAAMYLVPDKQVTAVAGLLALLALWQLGRNDGGRRAAGALILLAAVPPTLSILLSMHVSPVFIPRTMAAAAIPFLLLLAGGVAGAGWLRWAGWTAMAVIATEMMSVDWRTTPGRPEQDWYGAIRWLQPRFRPGDLVVAYPNEGALPFAYAVRDRRLGMPVQPIPTAVPSIGIPGGWYPTGSRGVVSLGRPQLRAIAQTPAMQRVPTIWLLRLGPWAYDKGDVFLDELGRDRATVGHYLHGPIDIIGLRRTDAAPPR
jgi:mannosyltransferase